MARGECACPCHAASFRENVGEGEWLGEAVSLRGRGLDPATWPQFPRRPQSSPVESEEEEPKEPEEPEDQDWEEDSGEGPPSSEDWWGLKGTGAQQSLGDRI